MLMWMKPFSVGAVWDAPKLITTFLKFGLSTGDGQINNYLINNNVIQSTKCLINEKSYPLPAKKIVWIQHRTHHHYRY